MRNEFDSIPLMQQPMNPPRCERKGTLPYPAFCVLVWDLLSGRVSKYFCDEHSRDARPRLYRLAKLIEYREQVKSTNEEEESLCAQ
jgi:hypothetical protein